MFASIVLLFTTVFLLYVIKFGVPWSKRSRTIQKIPGPVRLPLFGTRWVYFKYKISQIHVYFKDLKNRYGPLVKEETVFNYPVIHVFAKDDIEKVCKNTGRRPIRPPTEAIAQYRRSRPDRYANAGITNEQGETWYHLRCTITAALTSPQTIMDFLPEMEAVADDWCQLLATKRDKNGLVKNLEDLAGRLGLEMICALVLGRRMGFLIDEIEDKHAQELAEAVHKNFVACRDTQFGLPWYKFFTTNSYKRVCESECAIYDLATELIKNADDSVKESAIFQSIINADIDEREKKAAIVDFIAAGIPTVKNSLQFFLYQIAVHPEVQEKILKDDENKTYLKACYNETLRLTPTVTSLGRITEKDMYLSDYLVPANTIVVLHSGIACRSEENFKNAKQFWPERWINEYRHETVSKSTFIMTPFGQGRRICPGKRFIDHVLPVVIKKTLSSFKVTCEKQPDVVFEFLLSPKGPINMTFTDRDEFCII